MMQITSWWQKFKQFCHINMLKPYHHRFDLDGGKHAAIVVPVKLESVEEPDSDDEDKKVIRLKDSDNLSE